MFPRGRPRECALTRSLRDHAPVRETAMGKSGCQGAFERVDRGAAIVQRAHVSGLWAVKGDSKRLVRAEGPTASPLATNTLKRRLQTHEGHCGRCIFTQPSPVPDMPSRGCDGPDHDRASRRSMADHRYQGRSFRYRRYQVADPATSGRYRPRLPSCHWEQRRLQCARSSSLLSPSLRWLWLVLWSQHPRLRTTVTGPPLPRAPRS